MSEVDSTRLIGLLRRVIRDCQKLYVDSAKWLAKRHPTLIDGRATDFIRLMEDLHRGLLIKVYVEIVRADDRWTGPEKRVAAAMIEHLWNEKLAGAELREAAMGLFEQADRLSWASLVAPFVRHEPLAGARAQVETVTLRLANLIAKCDGQTMPEEADALHRLQYQIDSALYPVGGAKSSGVDLVDDGGPSRQAKAGQPPVVKHGTAVEPAGPLTDQQRQQQLSSARKELDSLIGLSAVKSRVNSYTNFLRLQQQRRDKGMSTMPISLHMAFLGNPGTGKTTVARIIGQILGAMGTLSRGHIVETDRSGLVAQYAGQTAVKTNELVDSAMGGVLFIDEAYSLVDASGDDAYGREAVGTLLKRMEDNRDDLAVILAGYSGEMAKMIESNPGLKSRINTTIDFEDYRPQELGQIFELMCRKNQYQLDAAARHRLLVGFDHLYRTRDRHFGNGRLVRNTFEDTVRRLADRVAETTQLSEDLLSRLKETDISISGTQRSVIDQRVAMPHRLRIDCEGCAKRVSVQPDSLGRQVRCPKCRHVQAVFWADVHYADSKCS
ncbi:AAA family ATPase [Crateriforma conspicua]|uniref:AAA family ATPase n=1 Tax=Crateriforma conspicua TaxID=2527996 RepID=UPI00118B57EA|nr:AAA family ATPase [Crateriforma conspicua]QDV61192.1 Stage V sporulation protein K [Crateriforma conspicua]